MRLTRRSLLLPVLFATLALTVPLFGCGGGGSSSPSPNVSPTPTVPSFGLATRLRELKSGDTIRYEGSGTYTEVGKAAVPLTARINHSLTSIFFEGNPCIQSTQSIVMNVQGTEIVQNIAEVQRQIFPNGDLFSIADRTDGDVKLVKPAIHIPGIWEQGYSYNNDLVWADGTTARETFVVTGRETVTVPIGRFETWKVTSTVTDSESSAQYTRWYAPQIGSFVKAEAIQSFEGGAKTFRFTIEAKEISFAF